MAAADPPKPRIVQRLEAQRARHRDRPLAVRGLYVAVGFTLLVAGAALLVLPGPAFVVIPVGLALLSLEFAWAEKLLHHALVQGEAAKRRAADTTTTERVITGLAVGLAAAALLAWGLYGDIPLLPM
ncbi:MAG TPA: PGPGW domain-containing protein [Solirubrobacteraceae bacterium]|nr:PGPGW domain-containing protein [Solirubrobacteraceae bacterium]